MTRKLPPGIHGDARFIDQGKRRLFLTRWWIQTKPMASFWLWIGMNPSVASGTIDDPTCAKEVLITKRGGGFAYVKCNVMDWVETDSRKMEKVYNPCSIFNQDTILLNAENADRIVCAWGRLPPRLQHHANLVLFHLLDRKYKLYCLGINKDGSPKHPLYLPNDSAVVRYYPKHFSEE